MTCAPAIAAVSAVSSDDPSSTTITSRANWRAFRTTEPMVAPSLKAGMATRIFESGNARRKTAGTAVDASLSMFLSTRQLGGRQGSRWLPPVPGRRNRCYKGFADIFKVGRNGKSLSLPALHTSKPNRAGRMSVVFVAMVVGLRSTKDRSRHVCIGTVISPLSPCGECPRVFAFDGWDLGRLGEEFDAIEIHPHLCERSVGPKAIPPAAADPQRPPARHGPGLARRPAHDGQRVQRREPHDPR